MSKYDPLWRHLKAGGQEEYKLTFEEIKGVLGFDIDHSFLTFKKEAEAYGYKVGKISLKGNWVEFKRN